MKFPRTIFEHDGCCGFIPTKVKSGGKDLRCDPIPKLDMPNKHRIVFFEGESWSAHRLSYHLNVAPIPRTPLNRKEGFILHSCDRKWCVKPDHLSIGTASKNSQENADRNEGWKNKRKLIMKGQKFPKRSDDSLRRIGVASKERMKNMWINNPEKMKTLAKEAVEKRWRG